jgi:hypothetical protein
MNILHATLNKRFYLYAIGLITAGGVLMASTSNQPVGAQAANSLYLSSANGSYPVGSTFTVSIRENSSSSVNAVEADLSYSTSALEYVSIDGSGSAFGIDASSTGGNGSVGVSRGSTNPVSGDQLVAKVTFKVLAITTASVQMQSSSVALSSTTNTNVVNSRSGGTYTLTTPVGSAPPTAPSPSPSPASPSPTPSPSRTVTPPTAVARPTTSASTVTIASQGNNQATPLPGDSVVELSTPATLEATPNANKNVQKVEYYVDGKLIATITTPPYSYSVDTTKYLNGKHTVTTKTHYKDGSIDSSDASLVVKNPFGLKQIWLLVRHYSWILIIVAVVIAGLIWMKRRGKRVPKTDPYGNDTSVDFGPAKSIATPPPQTTPFIAPAPSAPTVTVEPTAQPAPSAAPVAAPDSSVAPAPSEQKY